MADVVVELEPEMVLADEPEVFERSEPVLALDVLDKLLFRELGGSCDALVERDEFQDVGAPTGSVFEKVDDPTEVGIALVLADDDAALCFVSMACISEDFGRRARWRVFVIPEDVEAERAGGVPTEISEVAVEVTDADDVVLFLDGLTSLEELLLPVLGRRREESEAEADRLSTLEGAFRKNGLAREGDCEGLVTTGLLSTAERGREREVDGRRAMEV